MKKYMYLELIIVSLLAFCGGFCDGYTLLYRGGLFANMQTGNLVKFIISLANGNFELIYFLPIIVFCIGIIIATIINKNKDRSIIVLILMTISFLGSGFLPNTTISNIICVCLLSLAGAMQFETFRNCRDMYYTSTMCTNNMRLLSEGIVDFAVDRKNKKFLFYILIIVLFSLGVLVSAFLGGAFECHTISFLAILSFTILVLYLIFKKKDNNIEI